MRIRHPTDRSQGSGFTLIELILSASLSSMVLVAAYLLLNAGSQTQRLIESRIDGMQGGRIAMDLMMADLRAAVPLSAQFDFIGMNRELGDSTLISADNLDFATQNYTPKFPGEGPFCEVSYFLNGPDEQGEYALWRRRDSTPDEEPLSGGILEEIVGGVVSMSIQYYDGFTWYDDWGSTNPEDPTVAPPPPPQENTETNSMLIPGNLSGMPEAVSVTLSFARKSPGGAPAAARLGGEPEAPEPPFTLFSVARMYLNDRDLLLNPTVYGLPGSASEEGDGSNGGQNR